MKLYRKAPLSWSVDPATFESIGRAWEASRHPGYKCRDVGPNLRECW